MGSEAKLLLRHHERTQNSLLRGKVAVRGERGEGRKGREISL